ncbi:MerR family transcriptional regulator [Dellaglioa algida]|uniref:Glutamine synthetase repressor n=2 Tax=Dellaglioa algida TaxID=105612 RepID=A0A0R1HUR9_9LACO|nr:MerR family transcriptional regulator [Dellaglioa algida]KRK46471.1 glutamine synthetase repressor [Dellaglioa algida DSM 15638]MDK1716734.1 MerR family transcriptional regulator [Dellaglioa algida]MDK1718552.1 MerR family transcriptional regulator [Dellaglioa algida]MDK1720181.1 MerR family transcriptional regulator [Dellaglioa algida]MDK1721676.1 MerR family transcriptional regulator [Dellaglioa algida]
MKEKELRRSLAVLPIGTVMKLTDLTARQIRYYEEQELIMPQRNDGNRRMYSLNDIDKLFEIKDYLDEGVNMVGIKEIYIEKEVRAKRQRELLKKPLSDNDVRRIFQNEFLSVSGLKNPDEPSFNANKPL